MGQGVKQWRSAGAILGAITMILSVQSGYAARPDSSRMKTILVLGDSLSDGFTLPRSEAYPALLVEKLRQAGLSYEVMNASASGSTSEGGVRRLPLHLKRKIDILILQLGINDLFLGVPLDEIQNNLQAIVDKVKQRNPNVRIVIAGMTLPNAENDDRVGDFARMYANLAARNEAALVPYLLEGVGGDPLLNLPDRLHPNAAGQRRVAENVWRVLEPIAREVAAQP
jgi:acyl-CoA thioesterase I